MTHEEQEPGLVEDFELGLPGDPEPLPEDDADQEFETEINNDSSSDPEDDVDEPALGVDLPGDDDEEDN